jgi:hypothetical protein
VEPMWQLYLDVVLTTKNHKKKRNWPGSALCFFCENVETANHLSFFSCGTASHAWFCKFLPRKKKFHTLITTA